jgi:hypothetical protein
MIHYTNRFVQKEKNIFHNALAGNGKNIGGSAVGSYEKAVARAKLLKKFERKFAE